MSPFDVLAVALAIIGFGLAIFGLGAISAWSWAVKSLRIRPPAWITGVTAAAGTALAASILLYGNWFQSIATGALFALLVGNQLQIGPFRRRSGSDQAT